MKYRRLKRTAIVLLFVLLVACNRAETGDERPEFDHYFEEPGVVGSFMLRDLNGDMLVYYDAERCTQRFIPASTFKVLNALVALETGSVVDEHEIIQWDGVDQGYPQWNQDHNLRTAMEHSVVWFFQELARRTGQEKMQHYVDAVGYGNQDITGEIDSFWLEGQLRISQEEQITFLKRLYAGELPFSDRATAIVREIIVLEETEAYRLSGKTGWATRVDPQIGWFVGYLEQGENVYFFATNVESEDPGKSLGNVSVEITRQILQELGVLPA